jgi:hypothetical protein
MSLQYKKRELQTKRNLIVQRWDEQMKPLREARTNGGVVDWVIWDELTKQMQIEVTKIDQQLWELGCLRLKKEERPWNESREPKF